MCEDKLYTIAMQCAKLNHAGCSCNCHLCQFNIFNYLNDVREASLLKAHAYTDFQTQQAIFKQAERTLAAQRAGPFISLVILIVGVWWLFHSCNTAPKDTPPDIKHTIERTLKYLKSNPNNPENIPIVIDLMLLMGVKDVNYDGQINCIDYSVTFRQLYGDNAHLMINNNPNNGMNHMFVRVWNGYKIIDVEPQSTDDRYAMSLVWGTQYDPQFNKDVTSSWGMLPSWR